MRGGGVRDAAYRRSDSVRFAVAERETVSAMRTGKNRLGGINFEKSIMQKIDSDRADSVAHYSEHTGAADDGRV